MNVVIVGCGRVGAMVGTILSASHEVTIIDRNPSSFERLGYAFGGETHIGNGIDADVLRAAGVDTADLFLALTDGDNRNLMAAQVAQQLGAGKVIARVYDSERSQIFSHMGFITISPAIEGADRLYAMVVGAQEDS